MEALEAPTFTEDDVVLLRAYAVEEINVLCDQLNSYHESIVYDMDTVERRVKVGRHVPIGVMTAKLAIDYNLAVARLATWQRVLELLDDPSELRPKAPVPEPKKTNRRKKK